MIGICIRGAFMLLAVVMGCMLTVPAENDAAQSRLDPEYKNTSTLDSWVAIVFVSGTMWAAVCLAIKGI